MPAQDAIEAALRLCVGDPELDVFWANKESGFRSPVNVRLSVISNVKFGRDEVRYGAPDVDGAMIESVVGVRRLGIQIQVETDDQDLIDGADELADQIRAGFMASDVLAVLDAADLGGPQIRDPRAVDYRDKHGRWRSATVLEVWFNRARARVGPTIAAVGTVEGTGLSGPYVVDSEA